MTLEGEATSAPAGTTIVYANQKSGGPRVFGALAMLLGGIWFIMALLGLVDAGDQIELWSADETSYSWWFYVSPLLSAVSAGLFAYAGFLLWGYKKQGVWIGFGAVGVYALQGILQSVFLGMIADEVGDAVGAEGLGSFVAGAGLVFTAIGAVCCGLIVALPLLMNGNDLDDE
ncbi:MAG: hypothetical protein CBD52_004740 [Euryarchaeota archaeon TMED192]|nr:MAG: hypothetical protein CBD52_004740 [Euryarchaeota archaeon TMED192]|tara:strand:+ start:170 stop:688 length:519 start_codon:yes stop_codon:yes gene_type:complete